MAKKYNRTALWVEPDLKDEIKKESINRDFKSIPDFLRYLLKLLRSNKQNANDNT